MTTATPGSNVKFCPSCGGGVSAGGNFCPRCGHRLPTADERAPDGPARPRPIPGPPDAGAIPAGGGAAGGRAPGTSGGLADRLVLPRVDAAKLLAGDWAGAAGAAAAGLATALGLAAVLAVVAGVGRLPAGLAVTAVVILAGAAFGSDAVFDAPTAGIHSSLGAYPLTVTVIALAVTAAVFWRRIRSRRPGLSEALAQAVRTGLVFALALGVMTLVARSRLNSAGFGGDLVPATSAVHGSTAGAVAGGFLLSTLVCVAACLRKREWLSPRLLAARDLLGAPLAGLGAMLVAAVAVAVVGLLLAGLVMSDGPTSAASQAAGQGSGSGQDLATGLVVLVLALPTLAVYGLFLGIGAALSTAGGGTLGGLLGSTASGSTDLRYRITDLADLSPWWWLDSVGAIASILVGASVVAYLSGDPERARRTLLVFVGLFAAVTPLLTHLTAGYGHARALTARADGRVGISTPGAVLAALVVGLIVAVAVSAVAPILFSRHVPGPDRSAATGVADRVGPPDEHR